MKPLNKFFSAVLLFIFPLFLGASEEPIVLKTKTGEIHGTINIPESKKPMPVVFIHAGSGPVDRNGNIEKMENNSLKFIAEKLAQNNIASLRFDKRAVGESKAAGAREEDLRFETYIDDAKQLIEILSKDKRFSKIIVIGHSEGSLIGLAASIGNKSVSAYISIAGAGRPADAVLKKQMESQPPLVKNIVYPIIDSLKQGDTLRNVPEMLYSLFRPSIQPYLISWFRYDPQEEMKKLKIPALIIQGDKDIQVPVSDAELLSAANPAAELNVIKNMNHVLKDCTTEDMKEQMPVYSNPDLPLNKEFVESLLKFILKQK